MNAPDEGSLGQRVPLLLELAFPRCPEIGTVLVMHFLGREVRGDSQSVLLTLVHIRTTDRLY